jgi:hypothetical protein
MMTMRNVLSFLLVMVSVAAWAQVTKPLQFREESFDFGTIEEDKGPVTHEFVFTNATDRPIKILSVRASCGCTTPDWTREAVMPGKTGFIQAQFNPASRPGFFNKTLTVTTDFDSNPVVLQIKGQVNTQEAALKTEYNIAMGSWKLKNISFNLGKVFLKDEFVVREYRFMNTGDNPVTYAGRFDGPAHIKVEIDPKTVAPGEVGSIRISYNGKIKNQYGFQSDNIIVHTDDAAQPDKTFTVLATLEEFFPALTPAELAKAARMTLSATTLDLGRMPQNQERSQKITVTNTGKSVLNLRSIQGNCTCVKAAADKEVLKPGESASLTITFTPQNRRGTQQKAITIYSTDPQSPVQRVMVMAYVE